MSVRVVKIHGPLLLKTPKDERTFTLVTTRMSRLGHHLATLVRLVSEHVHE